MFLIPGFGVLQHLRLALSGCSSKDHIDQKTRRRRVSGHRNFRYMQLYKGTYPLGIQAHEGFLNAVHIFCRSVVHKSREQSIS
ncbi:hypothetical protein CY34DRAFT_690456 [Suillus luteus UH-Slu-Lm8-n1]|uniref:Uncharacterized protein n=1 Tax=Suillus luteus UH-Slu-Lm8-n1 TaxID=930992 RepID=A0A0D0B0X2_9AGAM|nr:hypothetical protein CY34DRAFT_690456 [Suillus luteus UH-Slu-Lm8-n1]